jgi:hypothetical protein
MLTSSPYGTSAARYRDQGWHVIPCGPGTKVPHEWVSGTWRPLPGWQKYCDTMPAEFLHDQWERWPDAGICLAHGKVIGLDLDTERRDVEEALHKAVPASPAKRRGAKGWMGYYRPGDGLDGVAARVRWYDPKVIGPDGQPSRVPVVELLLHGTQSVLPPTIHPGTGLPYTWITADTLESLGADDLPVFGGAELAALDREMAALGLTRQVPRKVDMAEYDRPAPGAHDLEKPHGRSINDRAMEPSAVDAWWPALDLPKSRQRGPGRWEAVPSWRGSGSGRPMQDRNPNLKVSPQGIVDFGADRSYTPIDVIMAARDCSYMAAVEWITPHIRAEDGGGVGEMPITVAQEDPPAEPIRDIWQPMPVFSGERSFGRIKPFATPTEAEYRMMFPDEPQPFPVRDFVRNCPGLLGQLAAYLDNASAVATEAGALAIALPMLGVIMGRAYETPTALRTNIYTVAIGATGSGKTSLVKPAKELILLAKAGHLLGNDDFASGSGLLKMLSGGTPKISFLDEFGHMLKQISAPGAGVHAKAIISTMTKLYSYANTQYGGTAKATEDAQPIDNPHLCLFGMSTPDQFWSAFGSSALEDGSVARYLVMPIGQSAPKEPDLSVQSEMVEGLEAVMQAIAGRVRGNLGLPECYRVPATEGAERARSRLVDTMSGCARRAEAMGIKGAEGILRRVAENAAKISLVSAVGRDPLSPSITEDDFAIGHALARWSATTMIQNIASHMADNQYERDVNAVERFVKEAGERGRMWREVQRRFRSIKRRDLVEIIEGLEREETVRVAMEQKGAGGHPVKRVIAQSKCPD